MQNLGLALGGGTARAMAHIGALKVLEEHRIFPKALAGTSSGAFMAALYALGTPALEMERSMRNLNMLELWSHAFDFGLHQAALVHGQRLQHWLDRKFFYGATFSDVQIPLAIACTDIESGELVVLQEGSLAQAVMASCALPGIFAPVSINGRYLMDGGFVSTVPYQALQTLKVDTLLGLHAGINAEASGFIWGLRRWYGPRTKRWQDIYLALPAPRPYRRLSKSLVHMLASYQKRLSPPEGAALINMNPPNAWWDFHRSPEAIAAGEMTMKHYLQNQSAVQSVSAPK